VALKHVFDKIKNIQEQELKELAEVSKKYRPQCQEVEERVNNITIIGQCNHQRNCFKC